jgi:hypothetical protein
MLAVVASMQNRAVLAGVMLGLACQVKIIPLVMSPVLFFFWLHRKQGWRFAAAMVGTLLVGWSAPLLTVPVTFVKQVLVYNSVWGWWGIPYLLSKSGLPGMSGIRLFQGHTDAQVVIVNGLKILVIAGAIFIAWRRRKSSAAGTLATMGLIWAVFFTFAPGFGVQYLAWVSPFLLLYSPRWFAAFTAAGSVGLFVFYNTISRGIPWSQGYGLHQLADQWVPWLLVPWAVFLAIVLASRREILGRLPAGEVATEAVPIPTAPLESAPAPLSISA